MTQWNDKRNNMDRISAFRPNKSNYMYPCLSGKNSNVMKIILDKRNIIIVKRRTKVLIYLFFLQSYAKRNISTTWQKYEYNNALKDKILPDHKPYVWCLISSCF